MVTNEQILLALGDIKEDIGGIKAGMGELQKLPSRVSKLEHERSRTKGFVYAVSIGVGAAFTAGMAFAKSYFGGQ